MAALMLSCSISAALLGCGVNQTSSSQTEAEQQTTEAETVTTQTEEAYIVKMVMLLLNMKLSLL